MNRRSLFVVLALLPIAATAAEWTIEPSVVSSANVTDNLNLIPGVRESTWWFSLSPAVAFSRNTESSRVTGSARLSANRYPGERTLDTVDEYFFLSSQLNHERDVWGLSASYVRDSTLQTELDTTGVPQVRRQRNQIGIAPSWQYSLTERSSFFANYSYERVRYEPAAGLTDYSDQQASAGVQYLWSERTKLTLTGLHSRFETETGSQRTDTSIVSGGLTYSASERLSLGLSAGVRHSDIAVNSPILVCPIGSVFQCQNLGIPLVQVNANSGVSDNGWLFDVSAEYRWDRTTGGMVIGQDINPTGSGLLVQTNRIGGTLKHEFSEKFFGSLLANFLQSYYLGGQEDNKSNYFRVDGSLSWNLSEYWRLSTGGSHAYQKSKNVPDNATANTLYISIGYNWPTISVPR